MGLSSKSNEAKQYFAVRFSSMQRKKSIADLLFFLLFPTGAHLIYLKKYKTLFLHLGLMLVFDFMIGATFLGGVVTVFSKLSSEVASFFSGLIWFYVIGILFCWLYQFSKLDDWLDAVNLTIFDSCLKEVEGFYEEIDSPLHDTPPPLSSSFPKE